MRFNVRLKQSYWAQLVAGAVLVVLVSGCGVLQAMFSSSTSSAAVISCAPTPADMEGPYYIPNAPFKEKLYPDGTPGEPLIIAGTVYAADCVTPLAGVIIDVWQADANGEYDFSEQYIGRGKVTTDANGQYQFETILPAEYEPRPPHIHVKIDDGSGKLLTSQLYFVGNNNQGQSGVVIPMTQEDGIWRGTFDIVLANS
jgi:protocatechuate 3,4-dioxygenase beta subunit